jgi:hypothetical protein
MAVVVSILFVLGCVIVMVLALGICRASSQAEDMLRQLQPKHFPDLLDGERG